MRPNRRLIVPLALATTSSQASIVVLAPILVEVSRAFGASISAVGQARAVLAFTAVAATIAIARLIDRLGVRPLLLFGATATLIGAALTAAAPSLPLFFAAQIPAGLGVACLLSAGFAGVGAYFEESDAAWGIGYVVGMQSLAWIIGNPIVGFLTESVSWRLAYAVPAVVSLAALVTCLLMLPRRGRAGAVHDRSARRGLGAVLRDASARRWTFSELLAYGAWTGELTFAGAFYIQTYGVSESTVGILLSIPSLAFLLLSPRVAGVTDRFGLKPVIVVGGVGMGALILLAFTVTPSVPFTVALICLVAVFAALRLNGSSTLGLGQLPQQPGSMMAARTASAQLGYVIGAVAGGVVLAVGGFGLLGLILFAGLLVSTVVVWGVTDPREEALSSARDTAEREAVPQFTVPD